MAECSECGAALEPAWKFCIFCGTPVAGTTAPARPPLVDTPATLWPFTGPVAATPTPIPAVAVAPAPAARIAIPSVIRPHLDALDPLDARYDDVAETSARPTFDLPLVLGIAIGVFGVVAMAAGFAFLIGRG